MGKYDEQVEAAFQEFERVEKLAEKEGRTHAEVGEVDGVFYLVGKNLPESYAMELQRQKGGEVITMREYADRFTHLDALTFELWERKK